MDIGAFDQPVLVFGGPYSNLEATQALLQRTTSLRLPPERVICTGHVVAYCADPDATTDLIASSGIMVVMGNCEETLSADSDDCGCEFAEGSICDTLSIQWYAHARENLTASAKHWMANLPRLIEFEMAGRHLTVVHGHRPLSIGTSSSRRKTQSLSAKSSDLDPMVCFVGIRASRSHA